MKKKPKVIVGALVFELDGNLTDPVPIWGFGYSYLQAACSVPFKYRHLSWFIYETWEGVGFHPDLVVLVEGLEGEVLAKYEPMEQFRNLISNQHWGFEPTNSPARNKVIACLRTARHLSGRWYDQERKRVHAERILQGWM